MSHEKPEINFVITDLDDTLWDWLEMWYNSFHPYLERIARETKLDPMHLKESFKELHQKYGTTEMSFAFKELPIIKKKFYKLFESPESQAKSILHEYYSNKKNNLRLYDGVMDTLKAIKDKGTAIVAFTESYLFFTKYRIKHLGLDGLIDCIYSPKGMDVPLSVYRYYSEDFWEPKITKIHLLPTETRKPNPAILEQIIDDFKADKSKTIYIGDKLDRDIYMAQQVNIKSVHAKYGHITESHKYALLKEVTHWTEEDVEREDKFKKSHKEIEQPTYVINRFDEIFNHFYFTKY